MYHNISGNIFKQLRTAQHIPLSKAVKGIDKLSISRLSHWENGDNDIPMHKLDQLLKNIHVSPHEFSYLTNSRPVNQPLLKINTAYIEQDIDELNRLANSQLSLYEKSKDQKHLYFCAVACNFYF